MWYVKQVLFGLCLSLSPLLTADSALGDQSTVLEIRSSAPTGRNQRPPASGVCTLRLSGATLLVPPVARNLARNPWYGMEFSVKYGV